MSTLMPLEPQLLLGAYAQGFFPMAEDCHSPVQWYSPDPRAVLPLEQFKISRSLKRRVKQQPYAIKTDHAFEQVIRRCALPRPQSSDTWINDQIIQVFCQLHTLGWTHSVEAWQGDQLVGGLYGLAMRGAFFGESMFSCATDASKICLVHLVQHLKEQGYTLLDVQLNSPHMARFGVIEIPRDVYLQQLEQALSREVAWGNSNKAAHD